MYHFSIFIFTLFFLLSSSCYAFTESEYQLRFVTFMKQYNRIYTHDSIHTRYEIFRNNTDFIDAHNNKNMSYYMKMNQYGDITAEEFAHIAHGYRPHSHPQRIKEIQPAMAPDHIDWRKIGYVSAVKNQLSCGSCWAFSSIASIETLVAIHTGRMIPLSEQQLVDCSVNGNHGCEGGIMDNAFAYIIHHNGICSESDYPYIGADGVCLSDTCTSVSTISDYSDIPPMNETAMRSVVAKNPVSVAIEADAVVFQFYGGGIIDDLQCGTNLNHGVTIIGYGFDEELDKNYWLVKNSWGTSWGENGYVRLIRDRNQCGIAQQASYPIY